MKRILFSDFIKDLDFFVQEAKNGKIFIYPTDTIYGIGGIWNEENIKKIADIKNRDWNKMFSVIAPNFDWILENYKTEISSMNRFVDALDILENSKITQDFLQTQLNRYHGVTWILNYNRPGVRILKHDIQNFVESLGEAFITTSVNIAGEDSVSNLDKLKPEIVDKVDYIIDAGICEGKPSILIDFVGDRLIER